MHVVFEVTNYKRARTRVYLCNGEELPKGHNHNICPRAECQTCKLFGHVAKDCVHANCLDVDVDWFNLLFTKSESTVHAYFAEVSVQAISLRTDGIVRTITGWDLLQDKFTPSANQLMEIKLASYSFKCDANRKYDQTVRRLNKPSESPIHFAFTTDYDDDSVPKCPHCRTYLFPQEVSKAMWSSRDTGRSSFQDYDTALSQKRQYLSRVRSIHRL
jgi:hypothetical protein